MRPLLLCVLLLAACDSPTPKVARWQKATVTEGGMTFGLHWTATEAEAYRTSKHLRPRLSLVRANAARALTRATGCTVTAVSGDQAIVTAQLDC